MRGNRLLVAAAMVVVAVLGPAAAASAHGDGDPHQIAAGSTGNFEISVWGEEAAGTNVVPVLVRVDATTAATPAEVRIASIGSDGEGVTSVATPSNVDGFWAATITAQRDIETPVILTVTTADGAQQTLDFTFEMTRSSLVMKILVAAGLAQCAAFATWMWGRRWRALGRPMAGLPAASKT